MNAMTLFLICAFALFLINAPVSAFIRSSSTKSVRLHVAFMSTGKTPLVANGKRFEADPGSSLMVVRAS